ncbi:MAG: alpha/beta fold hydrolase [Bacillota bacterium]
MRIENQVERRWLTLKGLRIHCLAAGETDAPVLLLHGVGLDSASLAYGLNIGPLSRYFKVFAPDWPGYGERDKPAVEYTTEFFIDFLGSLMDALGLESCIAGSYRKSTA